MSKFTNIKSILRKMAKHCPQRHIRSMLWKFSGVKIGKNTRIDSNVSLGYGTVLGSHVVIKKSASIGKGVIIGDNSSVFGFVQIGDSTRIMSGVNIHRDALIGDHVVLGNGVFIGKCASIRRTVIGDNSTIERHVFFTGVGAGKILIGKESYIGVNNILDWSDNITIGDYVHIAGSSTGLWTHTTVQKCLKSIPMSQNDIDHRPIAPIVIENNVYVGGNCTIYPGVTIDHHSVVAPNSAVTKDVESYTMVGGVPAKVIKKIKV